MEATMIKVVISAKGEFFLDWRNNETVAWIPVNRETLHLSNEIVDGVSNDLNALSEQGVTHFINNSAITFFKGEQPYCVLGDTVQSLQSYAEIIEARIIAQMGEIL